MPRWWKRYLSRHQHPASRILHLVGIPLAVAAAGWFIGYAAGRGERWWPPAAMLLVGYLLQWIGHKLEGNDMGEVILVKKLLGRPYVAVAPRYASQKPPAGLR